MNDISIRKPIPKQEVWDLIIKYKPYLYKLSRKWHPKFKHDNSITVKDLVHILIVKMATALMTYDEGYKDPIPFMHSIAKNHFLNLLIKNSRLSNALGAQMIMLDGNDEFDEFNELLTHPDSDPERKIIYEQLFRITQKKLNEIRYKPHGFVKRKRTFVRCVFDMITGNVTEHTTKKFMFTYRCYIRNAERRGSSKIPLIVDIRRAHVLGIHMNVDQRSINTAIKLIKHTIQEVIKEELPNVKRKEINKRRTKENNRRT